MWSRMASRLFRGPAATFARRLSRVHSLQGRARQEARRPASTQPIPRPKIPADSMKSNTLSSRRADGRQVIQEFQEFFSTGERAEGQFASHPRMHKDGILVQEPREPRVVLVKVIYPDARIYENHRPRGLLGAEGGSLRRGTTFARIATAQRGKLNPRFPRDKGTQSLADHIADPIEAGCLARIRHEIVRQYQCSSHAYKYDQMICVCQLVAQLAASSDGHCDPGAT